jgi:predicted metalloprotease with PDZ domain
VEEVSYWTTEGLMITGSALFLAPGDASPDTFEVTFRLPSTWQAVTPWPRKNGQTFQPASRRDLVSNAIFLGTATPTTLRRGGMELTLLLGECCRNQRELFVDLLGKQLDSYLELFGAPPRSHRYLIIVNAGTSGDGGAFASSFSQFVRGTADRQNRVIWGHVMAHELLHFWNGLSLVPVDSREEWFKEGVTDYLTLVTMSRNGLVDNAVVRNRLETYSRRMVMARLLQNLQMSPRAAGAKKQENRLLVYAGGSLAALAIDVELRKRTDDAKGLDDFMRALYGRSAKDGRPYGFDDLVALSNEISGTDMRAFLQALVDGEADFDIDPYLREIALRRDSFYEEQFITADRKAEAAARKRYRSIFGREVE